MDENKHLTPVWIIYADGRRLDTEHEGALRSITVTDRLNGISEFSIIFDTAEAKIREKDFMSLQSEVSIHLGYKDDVEEVFCGEVQGFRGLLKEGSSEQLEVSGSSALSKLRHGKHYRGYENKAPSSVIKGLLEEHSLKGEVEEFGTPREFHSEENQTDYEYLIEQAGIYGKQVYAYGTTVYVKDEITVRDDEIIYEWGKSLESFEASQNISGLISGVDYIGWDSKKNESFAGKAVLDDMPVKVGGEKNWSAAVKDGEYVETQVEMNCKDADEAKKMALGRLQKNSYGYWNADGKGEGNYKLRPGMRVKIKMAGETYDGEYIAETVTHKFNRQDGYRTQFTLKRNMEN
jgi:phage protein D